MARPSTVRFTSFTQGVDIGGVLLAGLPPVVPVVPFVPSDIKVGGLYLTQNHVHVSARKTMPLEVETITCQKLTVHNT